MASCRFLVVAGRAVGRGVVFWLTMAIHTPPHRQARILEDLGHFLHVAVTGCAVLTGANMQGMVEPHVIRQKMYLLPRDGLARVVRLGELLNPGAFGLHHHMTVHANI